MYFNTSGCPHLQYSFRCNLSCESPCKYFSHTCAFVFRVGSKYEFVNLNWGERVSKGGRVSRGRNVVREEEVKRRECEGGGKEMKDGGREMREWGKIVRVSCERDCARDITGEYSTVPYSTTHTSHYTTPHYHPPTHTYRSSSQFCQGRELL